VADRQIGDLTAKAAWFTESQRILEEVERQIESKHFRPLRLDGVLNRQR
jgi:hypothetical protein